MKITQSVINVVLVATVTFLLTFLLIDRFSSDTEDYPLENEVEAIRKEFYLYYLANGSYPTERAFLSRNSANLIAAYPDRFRWDERVFLHFTSTKGSRTSAPDTIGEPGTTFEHNCKVFLVHGRWREGFKDHYEATKKELEQAGVGIDAK